MRHVCAYANGRQKDLVYCAFTFPSIPNTIGLLETPTSFLCAGLWNPFSRRTWEITLLTLASRWEAWRHRRDGQQRYNDCNITVCSVHCMVPASPTTILLLSSSITLQNKPTDQSQHIHSPFHKRLVSVYHCSSSWVMDGRFHWPASSTIWQVHYWHLGNVCSCPNT